MNIQTPRSSDKTLLRRLDIFFLTFGIFDFTRQPTGHLSEFALIWGLPFGRKPPEISFLPSPGLDQNPKDHQM
jgi:hypothetical protein